MPNTVGAVSTHVLDVEQFKKALPDKMKKSVSQELVDQVNLMLADPDMYEHYRENLISYTSVMADGKFRIDQYVNAVKYVSHKLMGCTNERAYANTFPDKMVDFAARQVTKKEISSYVHAYNGSKLVNLILAQTLVPVHVLNMDLFQKAINTQAELMVTAKSEKVRSDAANSLLTHLKPPEIQKIELDIGVKPDSAIEALRASTMDLVAQQRQLLQAGLMTAGQVAGGRLLIDGEVENV